VAGLAEDHGYADAEIIAAEGEVGDVLHIVVEGTIRVINDRDGSEQELARRTIGDVVGEMSIVTQEPRMATLVAEGDVRTVTLGHREFESMLRERPSIALAVMRVLAHRVAEGSRTADL
jgi:CRP-like cAMP-binding protein